MLYPRLDEKSIVSLFLKKFLNEEATYELKKTVEVKNKLNGNDLIYKTSKKEKDKTFMRNLRQ